MKALALLPTNLPLLPIPTTLVDWRIKLAEETRGMAQGPMPTRNFMNEFLPWNDTTPKKFRNLQPSPERLKNLTGIATAPEAQTYGLFLKAFSGWPLDLQPGEKRSKYAHCLLQWSDSHATPDKFCNSLSVDLNAVDVGRPTIKRTDARKLDFANVETHTELKPKLWNDPYCDGDAASDGEEDDYEDIEQYASDPSADEVDEENDAPDEGCEKFIQRKSYEDEERADGTEPSPDEDYPFDNSTLCGQRTRGQISAYTGTTMDLAIPEPPFAVVIFGSYARLLRWDRSSVIVSRRFNYAEHPLILFRFYKRFAQLTLAQRGRDPRISIPTVRSRSEGEACIQELCT
ncbi:hypothetical protein EDD18DRAFT_1403294 [Armillaria luteobubalina]|uniref:Fungal-type protein kinase domain-containing protein n=1 Tax=Armillaria luteobubalina TaxID=153913 RepID=A0AA39Q1U8_9AGAR|nr:hypothetical protein EDD18DRAFT_1403294 [Armillaria luteobubalina]